MQTGNASARRLRRRIILIRHAQAESNLHGGQVHLRDPPLTPLGIAQATHLRAQLARAYPGDGPHRIRYTCISNLLRTLQTATVALGPSATLTYEPELQARPAEAEAAGLMNTTAQNGMYESSLMGDAKVMPELQETGNWPSDIPETTACNKRRIAAFVRNETNAPIVFNDASQACVDAMDWSRSDAAVADGTEEEWLAKRGLFSFDRIRLHERAHIVRQHLAALASAEDAIDGEAIAVVSHGAFIRYLLGLDPLPEAERVGGYYYNNCAAREYELVPRDQTPTGDKMQDWDMRLVRTLHEGGSIGSAVA
ncbi:histidine phosphatase superfamily [Protomyces lactucae-debilis]|uniref:Histidine phosphatase superfamily n=1 Tax=Protomyces lactucae-debilis TaxID=2754530 RepID=A0A1Y2FDU7_PROLT|nr:histidine phosphatase superfamily [Protomyces lactucae-debilis]ORY82098.1 histidine phosphatase superfamily [Protomyces lactucae-debilis]